MVPKRTDESVGRFYDSLAEGFRVQDSFWENPYDQEVWRLEHELLRPHLMEGDCVLDVGCGFYPHFEFTRHCVVVAGDLSFKSLKIARTFGDESGLVKLCQFDAIRLPFMSERFRAVIAGGELLNHLDDYRPAIYEFRRVLRKEGILVLQVGSKWCLDSLWALADAMIGLPIGYAMKRREALRFLTEPFRDSQVTWEIATSETLKVKLLSIGRLRRELKALDLKPIDVYGANSVSGLIPLPWQQDSHRRTASASS